jgi:hypothetical protein
MSEPKKLPAVPIQNSDIIAKLVGTGYLQLEQRNDPVAITAAIARMKEDLREGDDVSPVA